MAGALLPVVEDREIDTVERDVAYDTVAELNDLIAQQTSVLKHIMPILSGLRDEGRAHHLIESLGTPHVLTGWLRDWLCSRRGCGPNKQAVVDSLQIKTSGQGWSTCAGYVTDHVPGTFTFPQMMAVPTYIGGPGATPVCTYPDFYTPTLGVPVMQYNYILPPAQRNMCILRINRKSDFWALGDDPGREYHVVVTDHLISWAKPLPHSQRPTAGTYGLYPNQSYEGYALTYDSGDLQQNIFFRKGIKEFAAAFPAKNIDSIQVMSTHSYSTLTNIGFQFHIDDLVDTVGRWSSDPTGAVRFLSMVFPYMLGQIIPQHYAHPAFSPPPAQLAQYKKYFCLINPYTSVPTTIPPAYCQEVMDPTLRVTDLIAPPKK